MKRAAGFIRELTVRTVKGFYEARAPTMASSISFFALSTIAPLGVLTLWIGGLLLGQGTARIRIAIFLQSMLGKKLGAEMIALVSVQAQKNARQVAGIIAILFLIYGAGSLFLALQHALDVVWRVRIAPSTDLARHVELRAAVVFSTVFLPAAILVIAALARSLFVSVLVTTETGPPPPLLTSLGTQALQFLGAWLVIALLFATLPDASIGWKPIALGSGFTAVTWSIITGLFRMYLAAFPLATRFGAAGSFVALLIWLFVLAQLFLAGARLSYEFACMTGSPVKPRPWAELYEKVRTGPPAKGS